MPTIAITTREAAERLGISKSSLNARLKSGRIPVSRIGREGLHRGEFERWVSQGTPVALPTTPEPAAPQSIAINAGGVTLTITIEIQPNVPAGHGLRVVG